MGFKQLIDAVRAGQPVAAGVVNLPIEEVQDNALYLWDLIKAAGIGSTIIIPEATVSSDCLVGMPVYFNANTVRYERAIAGTSVDASGALAVADSAQIWGVVLTKTNTTLATLLVYGYAPLNLTLATEAGQTPGTAGTWYLSGVSPGQLTRFRPAAPIPVLKSDGQGNVFVCPQVEDFIDSHRHLHFSLKTRPAGDTADPGEGNRHVVTSPNPEIEGWLPADHAYFNGLAPHGAKFGYTLTTNPQLARSWPPLPPDNAVLYQNHVPVPQGPNGLVVLNAAGIWWMSNCYESVPWEPGLNTADSEAFSESDNECPYVYDWTLDLYFIQQSFLNETTVVTSLKTIDNRVVITCQGNPAKPASMGPLQISLDLTFLSDDIDPGGWLAIKSWDQAEGKFHRGPVATGIFAGSNNVTLASDFQTQEQILSSPAPLTTVHHGRVRLTISTAISQELDIQLVRLMGVEEQYFQDTMYLGFGVDDGGTSLQTALRGRVSVPETLNLTSPTIYIRLRLLGRAAGTLPSLTLTGRRIPLAGLTPRLLPASDTTVSIDTVIDVDEDNQYVDVLSNPITVAAGDDYLFTVQRSAGDEYEAEVGILRMAAILANVID